MDLAAILLLLALLVGVGLFLAAPLMRGTRTAAFDDSAETSSLLAERDRVISALQELDFDFALGKIPEAEYPEQRTGLLERGAEILRRLDALSPAPRRTSEASRRIEAAAAGPVAEGSADLPDDRIESMLAARRAARHAKSAGFCPRCGKAIMTSDRFCPHCGKSLH
jgi:hypothetical protein